MSFAPSHPGHTTNPILTAPPGSVPHLANEAFFALLRSHFLLSLFDLQLWRPERDSDVDGEGRASKGRGPQAYPLPLSFRLTRISALALAFVANTSRSLLIPTPSKVYVTYHGHNHAFSLGIVDPHHFHCFTQWQGDKRQRVPPKCPFTVARSTHLRGAEGERRG